MCRSSSANDYTTANSIRSLVLGLMHGEHFADGDRSEDRRRITLI